MGRKPLSTRSPKVLAAMRGQPSFWNDAVGDLLTDDEKPIAYATYALESSEPSRIGEFWTLFLTDHNVFWCAMSPSGDFTGEGMTVPHADIVAVGPVVNDRRGLIFTYAGGDPTGSTFLMRCRDSRSAIVIHGLMLTALDLTLGRPPFARFALHSGGRLTPWRKYKPAPPSL